MKAKNRPEFQRMIRMCELHQIDLIVTKSVSRFARNVKEALEYVRKLKLLGVGVIFEKEGINTMSLGDEMLLNTFTAIAQEESKAISQNQRLSIVKRMELGIYVDSNAPYGFRLESKQLVEYPPEADIVRWIFQAYLRGMSTAEIAKDLTDRGIPTKNGKEKQRISGKGLFADSITRYSHPHPRRRRTDRGLSSRIHLPLQIDHLRQVQSREIHPWRIICS